MSQISKSSTIILNEAIEKVFPLFSAKGEEKWVAGWNPEYIFPEDGSFVENQVFKTKSGNEKEKEYIWIVTYLNKQEYRVVYTVSTENRIWTVKVQCSATDVKNTSAEISYTYTALNKTGEELNILALQKMFQNNLKDWETAINRYLESDN
jgi:hypothetical protein